MIDHPRLLSLLFDATSDGDIVWHYDSLNFNGYDKSKETGAKLECFKTLFRGSSLKDKWKLIWNSIKKFEIPISTSYVSYIRLTYEMKGASALGTSPFTARFVQEEDGTPIIVDWKTLYLILEHNEADGIVLRTPKPTDWDWKARAGIMVKPQRDLTVNFKLKAENHPELLTLFFMATEMKVKTNLKVAPPVQHIYLNVDDAYELGE